MSVPSQRKSSTKTKKGRSHRALKLKTINACPKCKKPVRPHRVCLNCGTYKGKQVLKMKVGKKLKK